VALCTARARENLGCRPEKITVLLSANILKNAMGVGIPGTGMIGLPIAVALGALIGRSEYQLEVIKDLTPEALEEGKSYIADNRIDIKLKENITEKLYVEVTGEAAEARSTAVIACGHTSFVYEERDGKVLLDKRKSTGGTEREAETKLDMKTVWDFALTTPVNDLRFILQTKEYNLKAAEESMKGNYGHCLGKTMERPLSHGIFGNSIFSHIIAKTASACDARMGGAIWTFISGVGMAITLGGIAWVLTNPSGKTDFNIFLGLMLAMFLFSGFGNAGTFKQMPMIMPARQAGGAIGFPAAAGSLGPLPGRRGTRARPRHSRFLLANPPQCRRARDPDRRMHAGPPER